MSLLLLLYGVSTPASVIVPPPAPVSAGQSIVFGGTMGRTKKRGATPEVIRVPNYNEHVIIEDEDVIFIL